VGVMRRRGAANVDLSAPLPLGYRAAVDRAVELRLQHPGVFSWPTVAVVMSTYHGFDRSPDWWRQELRGRVPLDPKGRPFTAQGGWLSNAV
jgi:hypothetical protein